MSNLAHIELSELYDVLAQQTNRYMKMLSEGAIRKEFDLCREMMISIQSEIRARRNNPQSNGGGSYQPVPLRRNKT